MERISLVSLTSAVACVRILASVGLLLFRTVCRGSLKDGRNNVGVVFAVTALFPFEDFELHGGELEDAENREMVICDSSRREWIRRP